VARYDASIFSSPEFSRCLPIPQYLFYPAIDPLSEKNRDLPVSHPQIAARLGKRGHEHVKENFLITQNLKRYLTLFLALGAGV
jgi:hypothetical protein